MTSIFVKPLNGARVRNPARAFAVLPDAGDTVPDSIFWRRREAAKEVEIGEPQETPQEAPPALTPAPAPVEHTEQSSEESSQ